MPPLPVGGLRYCVAGSATAKNMRSVPMPAANSMHAHENVEYSGRSESAPMRTFE